MIGDLDLTPVHESLNNGFLLHPGPVFNKLLTGSYRRYDSLIEMGRVKFARCPHFIDELDLAVVARWSSLSEAATDKKARDIQVKLVEACQRGMALGGDRAFLAAAQRVTGGT